MGANILVHHHAAGEPDRAILCLHERDRVAIPSAAAGDVNERFVEALIIALQYALGSEAAQQGERGAHSLRYFL